MANKTIEIALRPSQYMTWTVTTETSNKVKVELKDVSRTYCRVVNPDGRFFAQFGHEQVIGEGLRLEITVDGISVIKTAESCGELVSQEGEVIGYTRCYAFEVGNSDAYKDIMISIITHKKQ